MHVINALTLLEDDMLFQILIYMGTCLKYFYMMYYMPTKHHKSSWTNLCHQAYRFFEVFSYSLYHNFMFVHLLMDGKAWLS